jgi:hypothetical protein
MSKKYYNLFELLPDADATWCPQFGDYTRSVVAQEERDMRDSGSFVKGTKFCIVTTDGTMADMCRKQEELNKGLKAAREAVIHEDDELREIARGAIERHLGDVCEGDDSADSIYDEAYTIAFDALHDKGAPDVQARKIAQEIAQSIAQP